MDINGNSIECLEYRQAVEWENEWCGVRRKENDKVGKAVEERVVQADSDKEGRGKEERRKRLNFAHFQISGLWVVIRFDVWRADDRIIILTNR